MHLDFQKKACFYITTCFIHDCVAEIGSTVYENMDQTIAIKTSLLPSVSASIAPCVLSKRLRKVMSLVVIATA